MDKRDSTQKIGIKFICFLLAVGLWFYVVNVENPIRTHELKGVPVELVNFNSLEGQNLAIAPNQDITVNLKLEGSTTKVFSAKPEEFQVRVDLAEYVLKPGINNIPVQIMNYPEGVNIKNSGFLGVKIVLEEQIQKEVEITSKVNIKYAEGVFEKKIEFLPNAIAVKGPKSLVDKVIQVSIVGDINNVKEDGAFELPIKAYDINGDEVKGVELSRKKGEIILGTTRGKSVPVNANLIGKLPEGYTLEGVILSRNNVRIVGTEELLNQISQLQTAPIDLSKIKNTIVIKTEIVNPQLGVTIIEDNKYIDVEVKISKEKEVTKEFRIPLAYTGLQEGLEIQSIPKNIIVKVKGYQKDIDKVKTSDLTASVDLSSYNEEGSYSIIPKVVLKGDNDVELDLGSIEVKLIAKKE